MVSHSRGSNFDNYSRCNIKFQIYFSRRVFLIIPKYLRFYSEELSILYLFLILLHALKAEALTGQGM